MITDFSDFCTWAYVLIDDVYRQLAPDTARPGPQAECSDAELITMALVGECCGWDQETELLSCWRRHRALFPHQPERTRFNRRRRALIPVINHLRRVLVALLDLADDRQCVIDSLPVPVVQFYHVPRCSSEWSESGATFGKCCSKKQTIYGYKLHLLITLSGVILDFAVAPANAADLTVGAELLSQWDHLIVLGDKAYISVPIQQALRAERAVDLVTLPRVNQRRQVPAWWPPLFNAARQIIETVNSQLAGQLQIEVNHAHSFAGLCARLLTKLTAHTLCVRLNRLLDKPAWLQIKALAFPI